MVTVSTSNVTAGNATNARIDHDEEKRTPVVFIDDGKRNTNQRLKTDNASTIGFNQAPTKSELLHLLVAMNASTATTATNRLVLSALVYDWWWCSYGK